MTCWLLLDPGAQPACDLAVLGRGGPRACRAEIAELQQAGEWQALLSAAMNIGRLTDDQAKAMVESMRSAQGQACPHCGSAKATGIEAKSKKVRDGVIHTNTGQSLFALLKRGVRGTFHHISKRHLHRYCDEFSFRWNRRKITDGDQAVLAIQGAEGKRLAYRQATKVS